MKKYNLMDKPHQVWNCDESGVSSHVATREKAYGIKGETKYQQKVIVMNVNLRNSYDIRRR